jgi:hypothetical protein
MRVCVVGVDTAARRCFRLPRRLRTLVLVLVLVGHFLGCSGRCRACWRQLQRPLQLPAQAMRSLDGHSHRRNGLRCGVCSTGITARRSLHVNLHDVLGQAQKGTDWVEGFCGVKSWRVVCWVLGIVACHCAQARLVVWGKGEWWRRWQQLDCWQASRGALSGLVASFAALAAAGWFVIMLVCEGVEGAMGRCSGCCHGSPVSAGCDSGP